MVCWDLFRGELEFFSALEGLRQRESFHRYLEPLRQKEWIVYSKAPFAGPEQVLDYVGCYTLNCNMLPAVGSEVETRDRGNGCDLEGPGGMTSGRSRAAFSMSGIRPRPVNAPRSGK